MADNDFATCYPEHAKLEAISESERNAIGAFIEWLAGQGHMICHWQEAGDNGEERYLRVTPEEGKQFAESHPWEDVRTKWDDNSERYCLIPNYAFESWDSRFTTVHMNPEKWLAEFYGVDLAALTREKQQMYEEMCAAVRRGE